jgi:nifR3 family TIM-barrel protein
MSYTEFIKAEFLVHAFEHMAARMKFDEEERPLAIQIYGDEPEEILAAAVRVQEKRPDLIDINLGCPARRVVQSGGGVGLMHTPLKVAHLFHLLSSTLQIPVTAKIRLGWESERNYRLIARIIEENGGAAIAVHARTKEQGFRTQAEWDAIAEVKAAVRIPVIGNGDIQRPSDIDRMKAQTGCDAVMIGRAAIGNPWIFARLDRDQVPSEQVLRMVHRHLERSLQFYGPNKGLILFRKHALQYLKLQRLPRARRTPILLQENPQCFLALLDEAFLEMQKAQPGSPLEG